MGEPPAARWLMIALAVVVLGFYALWALFSPAIYGVAPLTSCSPACPANVLQIGSPGRAIEIVGKVESYTVLTILTARCRAQKRLNHLDQGQVRALDVRRGRRPQRPR